MKFIKSKTTSMLKKGSNILTSMFANILKESSVSIFLGSFYSQKHFVSN